VPSERRRTPTQAVEIADPPTWNKDSFGSQQRPLELEVAAKSTECAPGGNHSMGWNSMIVTVTHDVSYGPAGARSSRPCSHITIRCDVSRRNTPDS
jgi:hypothetical protein